MAFGLGLVIGLGTGSVGGGLLAGFAVSRSGAVLTAVHRWLTQRESAIVQKMAARAAALKAKF